MTTGRRRPKSDTPCPNVTISMSFGEMLTNIARRFTKLLIRTSTVTDNPTITPFKPPARIALVRGTF